MSPDMSWMRSYSHRLANMVDADFTASELRPDTSVNRSLIEKLSVNAHSPEARLELLKQIALEYNMNWDSSKT
ncbi:unnamed protein product [Rhodiola kirilowii]